MEEVGFRNFEILSKIATIKLPRQLTKTQLSFFLKIPRTSPTFNNLIEMLVEKGIIEKEIYFSNTKILKINIKKLDNFIEKTKVYITVTDYIKAKNIFYNI